jgi:ceramide glucosyltransferase
MLKRNLISIVVLNDVVGGSTVGCPMPYPQAKPVMCGLWACRELVHGLRRAPVVATIILGSLSVLSLLLMFWQWVLARRFPLHHRRSGGAAIPVTLLKPLKGCDEHTERCLRSWFEQAYAGPVQILFGVADAHDPVCQIVRGLIAQHPGVDAELIICAPLSGANLKVSKLEMLFERARHEAIVISDADVWVPSDLLAQALAHLQEEKVGLVNCFYRLANMPSAALQWEAVAINSDFWSQVLQAQALKPMDFALGAVMGARRESVRGIGGFTALRDCLADDYQLGNRISRTGKRVALCPVVVECWTKSATWGETWAHQVRWARTIRVCQPAPYFFSILSNPTLWPLLWMAVAPSSWALGWCAFAAMTRAGTAWDQQRLLNPGQCAAPVWMPLVKDFLQTGVWAVAFLGSTIVWRGERMRLRSDGTMARLGKN